MFRPKDSGRSSGWAEGPPAAVSVATCLVGSLAALLTVAAFAPGMMSPDSFGQLTEARTGKFQDWHPPVMAALWRQLDLLVPGPFLMLLLHNLCFWSGLALIARLAGSSAWSAAVVMLGIGLWPTTFGLLGTIWKDTGLGCALVLATGLLCHSGRTDSRWALLLAIPVLVYASAVRHNAPAATLPFLLWWGILFCRGRGAGTVRWLALALGAGVFVIVIVGTKYLEAFLTGGKSRFPIQQILVHDLLAVSSAEGKVLLPRYLNPPERPWAIEDLRRIYDPSSVIPLFCCDADVRRLPMTEDPGHVADLRRFWLDVVPRHPVVYAVHRWRFFRAAMGPPVGSSASVYLGIDANTLGIVHEKTFLFRAARKYLDQFKHSFLFTGFLYLLASSLVLGWAAFRRVRGPEVYAVSLSGLLYAATLFITGTVMDFRMLWWSSVAALLAVPLLRISRRPAAEPGTASRD
jgi:hypothetical protein